jgi:hypothetical protein
MIGGTTFEEAACVAEMNKTGQARVILGSTYIHNSYSFLRELGQLQR